MSKKNFTFDYNGEVLYVKSVRTDALPTDLFNTPFNTDPVLPSSPEPLPPDRNDSMSMMDGRASQ